MNSTRWTCWVTRLRMPLTSELQHYTQRQPDHCLPPCTYWQMLPWGQRAGTNTKRNTSAELQYNIYTCALIANGTTPALPASCCVCSTGGTRCHLMLRCAFWYLPGAWQTSCQHAVLARDGQCASTPLLHVPACTAFLIASPFSCICHSSRQWT